MTHLKLRILASIVTLLVVLPPAAGHSRTPPTPAARIDPAITQLPRISIAIAGRGPTRYHRKSTSMVITIA